VELSKDALATDANLKRLTIKGSSEQLAKVLLRRRRSVSSV
jgi:hypothetical protein